MARRPTNLVPCRVCEKPVPRPDKGGRDPLCLEHAVNRVMDAASQLKLGQGPYFDRWLQGMELAIERARNRPRFPFDF